MANQGVRRVPMRFPTGVMSWDAFAAWWDTVQKDVLAPFDARNANTAFASALLVENDKAILGTDSQLGGRPSSSLPTVLGKVGDDGRSNTQKFLQQISVGGVSSRQDAGPVTADADAFTAQINIGAHTLQIGTDLISYNSGTITGLTPEENYYVYADDPNFAGGALTYYATTNGQLITANLGRYFVGAVRTTVALVTANITAATLTNPVQFTTSAAHGWNTGNTVDFDALPGDFGSALNAGTFTITRTGANTFTVPINATAFGAYTSGGTVTRIASTSISGQGGASGWIDNAFLVQF